MQRADIDDSHKTNEYRLLSTTGKSAIVGIALGLLYAIVFDGLQTLWMVKTNLNTYYDPIINAQTIVILLFFPIIAGILAIIVSMPEMRDWKDGFIPGTVMGLSMGLTAPVLTAILGSVGDFTDDPGRFMYLMIPMAGFVAAITLASVITTVMVAMIYAFLALRPKGGNVKAPEIRKINRSAIIILAVSLLILVVIPLLAGYIAIDRNLLKDSNYYYHDYFVRVERLDNGTIAITNNIDPRYEDDLVTDMPFVINVCDKNGKWINVTSLDTIKRGGASVTIRPSGGLGYKNGSRVELYSADLTGYSCHITVGYRKKNGEQMIEVDRNI